MVNWLMLPLTIAGDGGGLSCFRRQGLTFGVFSDAVWRQTAFVFDLDQGLGEGVVD